MTHETIDTGEIKSGVAYLVMALNERETAQLKAALQEAVVKCSERCLYQSAKWYSCTHSFYILLAYPSEGPQSF